MSKLTKADIAQLVNGFGLQDIPKILPLLSEAEKSLLLAELARLEDLKHRKEAQQYFLHFVKRVWPSFISGRHHAKMAAAFERVVRGECKRLIINMPPRHDLELNQEVPTTTGWKKIKDIVPGDYVFSLSGEPVLVTGKSPINQKRTYTVHTSDGAALVVSEDHLWTVRLRSSLSSPTSTWTTKDLYDRQERGVHKSKVACLPDHPPLQFPEDNDKSLPIDPYVLGLWLGDGKKSDGSIGCGYADKEDTMALVRACGYEVTDYAAKQYFYVRGIRGALKALNVLNNKHIPEVYKTASVAARRALLQGLIDSDGYVSPSGQVTFNNSNPDLVQDVQELIWSLGGRAHIVTRRGFYKGKEGLEAYRISFLLKDAARLPRKAARCKLPVRSRARTLRIVPTGKVQETQCLQVANEDGLFVAGRGCMVTHNTKSEFASYLLPAWFLGKFPEKKVIQASNTGELAVGFGRKVRNLVDDEAYKEVFPGVALQADSKAAGRWATNARGEYFAIGVGGTVTGKGADLLIIDDPHSEQEAAQADTNPEIYDKVYEWYTSGPRQRLQPGGAIIIVMTRWSKRDLTGQVLKASALRGGDEWEVIEFPAILPSGNPLWPEFWSLDELSALKEELPNTKWMAQYQQNPISDASAIVKREWWRPWPDERPPKCQFILQSWDTAFEKNNRADYSACTTWGVFFHPDDTGKEQANIILLNAFRERMEFPTLKQRAYEEWKKWSPDGIIVEKKATGSPLIYELRRMGVPVQEYTPVRGNDKISRLNAVADVFNSGMVWAPTTYWAEEVIDEVASFPAGDHDDYVDSVSLAMMRFRQGGFLQLPSDEEDPVRYFRRRGKGYY